MIIREIVKQELEQLLALYTYLHDNPIAIVDDKLKTLWDGIVSDPNHHIVVGIEDHIIISSCVMIVVPNLTREQRPYALIENVITHPAHRDKGYATQILDYAKKLAVNNHCYKMMLMTGSKQDTTLRFYERAGYNRKDKTAFVQWLE